MVEGKAPVRRRRLGAHGMMFRRRRIFAQLREGFTYEEIAAEEGVSSSRIRQIVSKELQQRAVDSGAEHAKLQLDRLAPAIQLAAEGMAAGDISAIMPYLKALDRLDRYQVVASANQVYDDEARKKLMDQDQPYGRQFRHRRELRRGGAGALEDDRCNSRRCAERGRRGEDGFCRFSRPHRRGAGACGDPLGRLRRRADFFTPNGLNLLKRLIPKK
jgi:hypothetical protein